MKTYRKISFALIESYHLLKKHSFIYVGFYVGAVFIYLITGIFMSIMINGKYLIHYSQEQLAFNRDLENSYQTILNFIHRYDSFLIFILLVLILILILFNQRLIETIRSHYLAEIKLINKIKIRGRINIFPLLYVNGIVNILGILSGWSITDIFYQNLKNLIKPEYTGIFLNFNQFNLTLLLILLLVGMGISISLGLLETWLARR